jgi:hypothetical protein
MKWMVVTESVGTLKQVDSAALNEVVTMESYRGHQFFVGPGDVVRPTIDCFTWAGCAKLVHKDPAHIAAEYLR